MSILIVFKSLTAEQLTAEGIVGFQQAKLLNLVQKANQPLADAVKASIPSLPSYSALGINFLAMALFYLESLHYENLDSEPKYSVAMISIITSILTEPSLFFSFLLLLADILNLASC